MDGIVEWFSDHKGYGYLRAADGTPVYIHHAQIRGEGFRTLHAGAHVRFRLGDDGRGPTALDLVEITGGAGDTARSRPDDHRT